MATLVDFLARVPTFYLYQDNEVPMSAKDFARKALEPLPLPLLRVELERWSGASPQPLYTSAQGIVDSYDINDLASFVSWLEQRGLVDNDGNGVPPQ